MRTSSRISRTAMACGREMIKKLDAAMSTRPVKITDPCFGEQLDLFDDLPEPEHPRDPVDSAVA